MSLILTIDASALESFDSRSYIADYFDGFVDTSRTYYGGTPDIAFFGPTPSTFYVNGSQVMNRLEEDDGMGGTTPTDKIVMLEGDGIAYDFIHNGAEFGHGISGAVDGLVFGNWVDGVTTGTEGTGAAGRVSGLDAGLIIEGFGASSAAGAGTDPAANPVYAIYDAVADMNADALMDIMSGYSMEMAGTSGDDMLRSYAGKDVLSGLAGDDVMRGAKGGDVLLGGLGDDALFGNRGSDTLRGGSGEDTLMGGRGRDELTGGAGEDTFVFGQKAGKDIITDFTVGEDVIDVQLMGLSSKDDFTVATSANGIVISSGTVSIALHGLAESDLTDSMFLF